MHSLKDLIKHRTSSMASSSTGRVPQGEVIMDVSRFFSGSGEESLRAVRRRWTVHQASVQLLLFPG